MSLVAWVSRLGGAIGLEDAQVDEPGAAVELGEDGLDQVGVPVVEGIVLGLQDDDAGDLLGRLE